MNIITPTEIRTNKIINHSVSAFVLCMFCSSVMDSSIQCNQHCYLWSLWYGSQFSGMTSVTTDMPSKTTQFWKLLKSVAHHLWQFWKVTRLAKLTRIKGLQTLQMTQEPGQTIPRTSRLGASWGWKGPMQVEGSWR